MITAAEAHTMMPSSIKKKEEIEIFLHEIEEKIKIAAENDKNYITIDIPNYECIIKKKLEDEYGFDVIVYSTTTSTHKIDTKMYIGW